MTAPLTATDPAAVTGDLSRKVLQYGDTIERIVREAKEPGWSADSGWRDLEGLLDTAGFRRVGNDKAAWAGTSTRAC